MHFPTDINNMVDSYKGLLRSLSPTHYKQFCERENADKDSALAEALVFTAMQRTHKVSLLEDGKGGADFFCETLGNPKEAFVLEVTSLNSESVSKKSGIENKVPEPEDGGAYELANALIWTKVSNKAPQLADYPFPRVLAIFLNHFSADLFMSRFPIRQLMTGRDLIQIKIDDPHMESKSVTHLEESLFFRLNKDTKRFEICRQSISAILLFTAEHHQSHVYGMTHPQPSIPFPINYLPDIPFCRINPWPPVNGILNTEWTTYSPPSASILHFEADLDRTGIISIKRQRSKYAREE